MSKNPLRIIQIMGAMDRGGAENLVMNIYREIDRSEIQFDFVVHTNKHGAFDDEIVSMGGTMYHAPKYRVINHRQYCMWWHRFFQEHNEYRIIHSHVRSTASIIFRIAKKYEVYTIAHSHSTSNGSGIAAIVKKLLQSGITKHADLLLACSNDAGKWLYKTDNFVVLKNGINLSQFKPNSLTREAQRKELCIEDSTFVCGHVGRLYDAKNHVFLIEVFSEVLKRQPGSILLLIGDGPLRSTIQKSISGHDMDKSVLLLGTMSNVNELLQAIDVFVFPSKWEGFPVSLLEAQAVGLPCVVSDTITTEAVLAPNVKRLSLSDSQDKWANEIIKSYGNRLNNVDILKKAGYDMSTEARRIECLYKDILNQ